MKHLTDSGDAVSICEHFVLVTAHCAMARCVFCHLFFAFLFQITSNESLGLERTVMMQHILIRLLQGCLWAINAIWGISEL